MSAGALVIIVHVKFSFLMLSPMVNLSHNVIGMFLGEHTSNSRNCFVDSKLQHDFKSASVKSHSSQFYKCASQLMFIMMLQVFMFIISNDMHEGMMRVSHFKNKRCVIIT